MTGLRGVGKTVLLESLKPIAQANNWLWTGNDLSESISLTEERIAQRLVVYMAALLSPLFSQTVEKNPLGFTGGVTNERRPLSYEDLWSMFERTPGLCSDKLRAVFDAVSNLIEHADTKGIIFALTKLKT